MNDATAPPTEAAEAAAWWRAKLDGDDATETHWLAYEQWLTASPLNRAAADAIDSALLKLEAHHDALRAAPAPETVVPFTRRLLARPAVWITAATALAASALLFVVTAPPPEQHFAYAAPATMGQFVDLPDGSVVHLNRGAAIFVTYGRERHVDLTQGEASFSVVHDPSRPFVVAAGDASIRDVGTEFNVAVNAASTVVTVRAGEIAVSTARAAEERVIAGLRARIANGEVNVSPARADDAFAWQSGRLVYHNAELATVIEDLNRYSDTPIILDSEDASALQFSGVLVIDQPQTMLARLEAFLPIRSEHDGDRIVVRRRS
ncbi:MAG: FecR domain-containing protein [Alphaproteobacteria bacterium]|nr:FecR domain-containing protein [Alphaproteobacteria bacterium]